MNEAFQRDAQDVLKKHPLLKILKIDGKILLKGILDIKNETGDYFGSYSIEIHSTGMFPYRFPKVYEVGGDIPKHGDWHINKDDSCCLTIEPDEIIKCKYGITLLNFIDNEVIPYFANQIHRKTEGRYLNEYPHGIEGLRVFYSELFKTDDVSLWLKYLENTFCKLKITRNEACYCNSGQKHKKCHLPIEKKLILLGKDTILKHINIIKI